MTKLKNMGELYRAVLNDQGPTPEVMASLKQLVSEFEQFYDDLGPLPGLLAAQGIYWERGTALEGWFGTSIETQLVQSILDSIPYITDVSSKRYAILMLSRAEVPFNGSVLLKIYETIDDWATKYEILATLMNSNATGVTEWLRALAASKNDEFQWVVFGLAAQRKDSIVTEEQLLEYFPINALVVLEPLKKLGSQRTAQFFKEELSSKRHSKQIQKRWLPH